MRDRAEAIETVRARDEGRDERLRRLAEAREIDREALARVAPGSRAQPEIVGEGSRPAALAAIVVHVGGQPDAGGREAEDLRTVRAAPAQLASGGGGELAIGIHDQLARHSAGARSPRAGRHHTRARRSRPPPTRSRSQRRAAATRCAERRRARSGVAREQRGQRRGGARDAVGCRVERRLPPPRRARESGPRSRPPAAARAARLPARARRSCGAAHEACFEIVRQFRSTRSRGHAARDSRQVPSSLDWRSHRLRAAPASDPAVRARSLRVYHGSARAP